MTTPDRTLSARPLLCTRVQASQLLGGVDVSYIRRLEDEGILHGIRLSRSPSAQVFFRLEEIEALVADAPIIERRRPDPTRAHPTVERPRIRGTRT